MKTDCISCVNTQCLIQQDRSPELISGLNKFQIAFKQGQHIITEGFPVLGIFFIQKGKVKVFSTGLDGRQQIVRFANDGDVLGHRGVGNDVYPIGAVAMEDSLICFVEYEMFMSNPKFTFKLMLFYSRELLKVETRMKSIAQMNIRERIAEALLLIWETFGLNEQKELNAPFSLEDIANTADTTIEQVFWHISDFEDNGFVAKRDSKIVLLKIEKLKEIISAYNPKMIKK